MELIRIGLLGIVGVLFALQFKNQKTEVSMYIGLAVAIIIFHYVLSYLFAALEQFKTFQTYLGAGSEYLKILLKVVGITYICEFSSGICKDAGYSSVAMQIELLGKLSVLFAGLPILFALVQQMEGFW